jgi:REP element-mobilizing transposase RayT
MRNRTKAMTLPRYHIEGHVYFITTVTHGRVPLFTRPAFITPLLDSLNYYRHTHPFKLLGYVIMPDHIHLLIWPCTAPAIADLMRDFKKFTAVRLIRQAEAERRDDLLASFAAAGETTGRSQHKVWQDSY